MYPWRLIFSSEKVSKFSLTRPRTHFPVCLFVLMPVWCLITERWRWHGRERPIGESVISSSSAGCCGCCRSQQPGQRHQFGCNRCPHVQRSQWRRYGRLLPSSGDLFQFNQNQNKFESHRGDFNWNNWMKVRNNCSIETFDDRTTWAACERTLQNRVSGPPITTTYFVTFWIVRKERRRVRTSSTSGVK